MGKTALPASRVNKIFSRFPGAKSRAKEGGGGAKDAGEKKSSSLWDWKPLRALAHIGRQHLACEFSLRVSSAEGLGANVNGVKTRPDGVNHGVADFGETLYHECSVYGGSGSQGTRSVKVLCAFCFRAGGGRTRDVQTQSRSQQNAPRNPWGVDLTAEERSGSWTTNFKVTSKEARGGVLVVTLGKKILDREVGETSSAKIFRTNSRNPGNPGKLVKATSGVDAVKKPAGPMGGSLHALKLGLLPISIITLLSGCV